MRVLAMVGFFTLLFNLLTVTLALAIAPSSYRLQHPIGWMHALPVGETPGWSSKSWLQFSLAHGNIWNNEIAFRNINDGTLYKYHADFEQSNAILEFGWAHNDRVASSFEIPYALRAGGFLDRFIDDFHVAIGSDRFNRPNFPENQRILKIETDNQNSIDQPVASGFGNLKYKLKYWPWQWRGKKGQCPCGFSLGTHFKIPIGPASKGLTSGNFDYSLLWHLGAPVGDASSIWLSSAVTFMGTNDNLRGWPMRRWHQMYEISFDIGLTERWGFLIQMRAESPLMNYQDVQIESAYSDPDQIAAERIASGWNSLVHWRGSQGLGWRWRSKSGLKQFNALIIEDWGLGAYDREDERLYVNNAPDVSFLFQYSWGLD